MSDQEKKLYELLYIIPGSLSEQECDPISEQVRALIEAHGGEIVRGDKPVRRKLAYAIKQYSHGFYILMYFSGEPEGIAEINTTLIHTPSILRHLIIQTERMTELAPQYAVSEQPKEKSKSEPDAASKKEPVKHHNEPLPDTDQPPQSTDDESLPSTEESAPQPHDAHPQDETEKPAKKTRSKKKDAQSKISLDDLDEKLDEILTSDTL